MIIANVDAARPLKREPKPAEAEPVAPMNPTGELMGLATDPFKRIVIETTQFRSNATRFGRYRDALGAASFFFNLDGKGAGGMMSFVEQDGPPGSPYVASVKEHGYHRDCERWICARVEDVV